MGDISWTLENPKFLVWKLQLSKYLETIKNKNGIKKKKELQFQNLHGFKGHYVEFGREKLNIIYFI